MIYEPSIEAAFFFLAFLNMIHVTHVLVSWSCIHLSLFFSLWWRGWDRNGWNLLVDCIFICKYRNEGLYIYMWYLVFSFTTTEGGFTKVVVIYCSWNPYELSFPLSILLVFMSFSFEFLEWKILWICAY